MLVSGLMSVQKQTRAVDIKFMKQKKFLQKNNLIKKMFCCRNGNTVENCWFKVSRLFTRRLSDYFQNKLKTFDKEDVCVVRKIFFYNKWGIKLLITFSQDYQMESNHFYWKLYKHFVKKQVKRKSFINFMVFCLLFYTIFLYCFLLYWRKVYLFAWIIYCFNWKFSHFELELNMK